VLDAIVAAARRIVEVRRQTIAESALERSVSVDFQRGRFAQALREAPTPRIVAECKRRSPSRGVLRPDYDPSTLARAYEASGAAAISVLTEPTFFDGAPGDLQQARAAVALPILRKDFIVDRYQLLEARAWGADAVLLIVAALQQAELRTLVREADRLSLDAIVEVHDETEMRRAVDAGASIIGVNHRDLRTLTVDSSVSERLIESLPGEVIAVAESGIRTGGDVARLSALGYDAFLVGEHLMTAPSPAAALRELIGSVSGQPAVSSRARLGHASASQRSGREDGR
jgi:indole-3-glycerol phosphate synthase